MLFKTGDSFKSEFRFGQGGFDVLSDSPVLIVEERFPGLICLGVSARSEAGDHTDLEVCCPQWQHTRC